MQTTKEAMQTTIRNFSERSGATPKGTQGLLKRRREGKGALFKAAIQDEQTTR